MNYCNDINANAIDAMNDVVLDCMLSQCEKLCDRYFQCDTVALMQDKLKELTGEE